MPCVQNPGKSRKRFKMKRKYQWPAKKAKANVNMDCFSLIKLSNEWQPRYCLVRVLVIICVMETLNDMYENYVSEIS